MMDEISTRLEAKLALSSEGGKIDYGEVGKQAKDTEAFFFVGKFLTNKKFSLKQKAGAFILDWTLKGKGKIAETKNRRYVFRFDALEDSQDLFDRGPWSFRNTLLMTQVLDGTEDPVDVELELMPLWVEIKGLKPAFKTLETLEFVGKTLGAFVKIDPTKFEQDVYKARFLQDIKKPLRLGDEFRQQVSRRQRLLATAALAVPALEENPVELEHVGLACNEPKGLPLPDDGLAPQTSAFWACKLSPLMHLKFIFMKTIEEVPSVAPEKN